MPDYTDLSTVLQDSCSMRGELSDESGGFHTGPSSFLVAVRELEAVVSEVWW